MATLVITVGEPEVRAERPNVYLLQAPQHHRRRMTEVQPTAGSGFGSTIHWHGIAKVI